MLTRRTFSAAAAVLLFAPIALADPPIWESDFGAAISALTTLDDATASVVLSFNFPFDGSLYSTIFVGTNGDLQLGSLGTDGDIDFDHWIFMEEFTSDGAPSIAGLNTDLSLSSNGTIHFNDFGDRAVFTWNEVGTFEDELALITFQITLYPSGRILLGFNGVLDGVGESLITDLSSGIVVGVTGGDIAQPTNPDPIDLSFGHVAGTTAFDRWCFDTLDSCGVGDTNLNLPGRVNTDFDLDQTNVEFVPIANGFTVNPGAPGPPNLRVRCNDDSASSICKIEYDPTDSFVRGTLTEYLFRIESGVVAGGGVDDFTQTLFFNFGNTHELRLVWSASTGQLRVQFVADSMEMEELVSGFSWAVDTDYFVEIESDTFLDFYNISIDGQLLVEGTGFADPPRTLRFISFRSAVPTIGAFQIDDVQITGLNAEGVLLLDTFENGTVGETQVNPDIGFIGEGTFGDRKIIVPEPGGSALIAAALLTLASLKRRAIHRH